MSCCWLATIILLINKSLIRVGEARGKARREARGGGRRVRRKEEGRRWVKVRVFLLFSCFFFFFRFTLGVRFRHFFFTFRRNRRFTREKCRGWKSNLITRVQSIYFSFIWFREKSGKATSGNFVNYEIICLWKGSLLLPRLSKKSLCETREKENGDKNKSKEDYGCFADHNARSYHGNYYHGYYYHLCLF